MTESVLFVCEQNVCRSPLMAAAFDDALHSHGLPETGAVEWVTGSAGTQASTRHSACRYVVAIEPEAAHHVSHRLEVDDVEAAGLVIAASLEERSLIVQLSPKARSRTFTLREALLLGEQPIAATSLAEYAAALASRRGTLDLRPRRGFPWIRPVDRPLDVVDVHRLGPKPHRNGLLAADADARLLAARLRRDLSSSV
ncbi:MULTISPECIES: arsenate reductase/protein-tyrosine-phosphatase family protein [unclassified Microbacterium]|uniref:arsenate reductase/protein-tyrosine-phosphatase family protein n=1 Tax=unclassified Microbacterium TaxID=2609290 RepID=UPI003015AEC4